MTDESSIILAIENSNPSAGTAAGRDDQASGPGVAIVRATPRAGVGRERRSEAGGVSVLVPALELLASEPIRVVARDQDDLIPAIDRATRAAGLLPRDFSVIAVSVGPGGYTAVRSACSAGKMIAETTGARCVAVPSAMVAALAFHEAARNAAAAGSERVGAGTLAGNGAFAVCLASKDRSSYATRFERSEDWHLVPTSASERGLIHAAELADLNVWTIMADRHFPDELRAEAARLGIGVVNPEFCPEGCARLASVLATCDPVELNPHYPREPDAVTLWRARQSTDR